MDYQKIYVALCARGNARLLTRKKKSVGFEDHHILPRSMLGPNDLSNLARLSAKEHFIAHRLLARLYPENVAMQQALWLMQNTRSGRRLVGRSFELARVAHARSVQTLMADPARAAAQAAVAQALWADPLFAAARKAELRGQGKALGKAVVCLELDLLFESQSAASRHMASLGFTVPQHHISQCVNEKSRITAGRFSWVRPGQTPRAKAYHKTQVLCVEKDLVFESQKAALAWLRATFNISPSSGFLNSALKGVKRSAYGFTWRYA